MTSDSAATVASIGVRIDANDFDLFELPMQFAQNRSVIDARWKALQRQLHPDRFMTHGDAAQRVAMQWAIRVNGAYQRLKHPLSRAAYLCQLHGVAMGAEARGAVPAAFLAQQMAWRETLEQATALHHVDALAADVNTSRRALEDRLAMQLDAQRDWADAAQQITALMYIERLAQDIERHRDSLSGS